MNFKEALCVLKLTGNEDRTAIKRQYRRLMGQFHPDVIGSDRPEHIQQAQLINEAYGFLKDYDINRRSSRTGRQNGNFRQNEQHPKWQGMMNEAAFCERPIYLYYNLDDEETEHMYYHAADGKYIWQPENEELSDEELKEIFEDMEAGKRRVCIVYHEYSSCGEGTYGRCGEQN